MESLSECSLSEAGLMEEIQSGKGAGLSLGKFVPMGFGVGMDRPEPEPETDKSSHRQGFRRPGWNLFFVEKAKVLRRPQPAKIHLRQRQSIMFFSVP